MMGSTRLCVCRKSYAACTTAARTAEGRDQPPRVLAVAGYRRDGPVLAEEAASCGWSIRSQVRGMRIWSGKLSARMMPLFSIATCDQSQDFVAWHYDSNGFFR